MAIIPLHSDSRGFCGYMVFLCVDNWTLLSPVWELSHWHLPDSIFEKYGKTPHKYKAAFPMRVTAKPSRKAPNSMQFMGRNSWSDAPAAAASLGPIPRGTPLPRWHTGSSPSCYGGPESPAELTPAEEPRLFRREPGDWDLGERPASLITASATSFPDDPQLSAATGITNFSLFK